MSQNYYQILGVSKTASQADLKKAYLKLAKQYHPDTTNAKDAEKKFKEINAAYDVLKDEQKELLMTVLDTMLFKINNHEGEEEIMAVFTPILTTYSVTSLATLWEAAEDHHAQLQLKLEAQI